MSKVEFNKIIFKVTPTTCTNRPNTEGMLPVSSLVFFNEILRGRFICRPYGEVGRLGLSTSIISKGQTPKRHPAMSFMLSPQT